MGVEKKIIEIADIIKYRKSINNKLRRLHDTGEVKLSFSAYEGMCNYIFDEFGTKINTKQDEETQRMALNKLTKLIELGVLILKEEKNDS